MSTPQTETRSTAPEDVVPVKNRLAYGVGACAERISFDSGQQLANPIFNITLGLPPLWVGAALAIPRVWDAFIDPVVGALSDKCTSRWGRRRPFIFAGAILASITFVVMWYFPRGLSHGSYFAYFLGISLLYYTMLAFWLVPYQALSYELSPDYHERTRVQGIRAFFGGFGSLIAPWLFYFTQLSCFKDTIDGLRALALIAGTLILVCGLAPALFIKERPQRPATMPNKWSLLKNMKVSLQNSAFRRLLGVVVLVQIAGYMVSGLGFYVISYHILGGNLKAAGALNGWVQSTFFCMVILGAPMTVFLSRRIGKRRTFMVCCGFGFTGSVLKWFCYTPSHPYLALMVPLFLAPGYSGSANLLFNAMVADICDQDELQTGFRREGLFGAMGLWILKLGQSLSFFVTGAILAWVGFNAKLGAAQAPETLTLMRAAFAFVPAAAFLAGMFLIRYFPLTEQRAYQIRADLKARNNRVPSTITD